MRLQLSAHAYRRITAVALVALAFIIVTGGAVRLTGSGLGCTDWPSCEQNQFAPDLEYHAMVEWINRVITGFVSVAVILAVLGAIVRERYRRDLMWLAVGLVAMVVAQILLGGLLVRFHLWPPLVMGHFVLSLAAVADATVLHHRAGLPEDHVVHNSRIAPEIWVLARWLVVSATLVVLTGTIVTGTGPHGGDKLVERLPFEIVDVARVHGVAVWLFIVAVLATLWLLRRTGAPAHIHRHGYRLLFVSVVQGTIGYVQYNLGVPEALVAFHLMGAVLVWWETLRFSLRAATLESTPAAASVPAATISS